MLSCREVLDELGSYLEDPASVEIRRELEAHLATCKTCRVLYDSARKTLRIVTESGSFDLPRDLADRLVAKVMNRICSCGPDTAPPEGGA